jgi:SsrA-binding protein
MAKKPKTPDNNIAQNKRARFDYHIEEKFEAGVVLQGWEVKSLREGKGQITETYVHVQNGEAWLIGTQIQPLNTVSTHFVVDPQRTRKLLLNRRELNKLSDAKDKKGKTIVALSMFWKNHLVKCQIAIASGKRQHDKRNTEKDRDWGIQKRRIMSHEQR